MIDGLEAIVLLIIVLILLFFGPTKLPELARGIGRAWGELRLARKESELVLASAARGSGNGVRDREEVGKPG
jgi:TatA/E family protein of Tat protein translocase